MKAPEEPASAAPEPPQRAVEPYKTQHFWDVQPMQDGGVYLSVYRRVELHQCMPVAAIAIKPSFGKLSAARLQAMADRFAQDCDAELRLQGDEG